MSTHSITVSARFTGPPRSANGGYVSGRLARYVDGESPVTVTLRTPPPLETTMQVDDVDGVLVLRHGDTVVAEAAAGDFAHDPVAPIDSESAERAHSSYPGLSDHPFPTCFSCGPDRRPGDGLRLTPGQVGPGRTACLWVPHTSVASDDDDRVADAAFVWSALDCPGGWASDLHARPLVLGRMTAQCYAPPVIGEPQVVVGRLIQEVGRKTLTATALYDNDGRVLGRAEHVWIAIDPADFGA
jgi:hypothetical protein